MAISRIATNISALDARNNVNKVGSKLKQSIERLSSGLRINRAADDAAGMSVANRLISQTQGLKTAVSNAQDGINLISVAESALEETTNRLNRIRLLSLQASNTGTYDDKARLALQDEVFQNIEEITRIANSTQFGSNYLLKGDYAIQTQFKDGQQDYGIHVDPSPVASSLGPGSSFLNIRQVQQGYSQIIAGEPREEPQVLNIGILNQSDIAVSLAFFSTTNSGFGQPAADAATTLQSNFFNGVSIANSDVFVFDGVLSDGMTKFTGSLSLSSSSTTQDLVSAIQISIDAAEKSLFGVSTTASVPTSFLTNVAVGTAENKGRILFSSSGDYINQANLNLSLIRNGDTVTKTSGLVRGAIGAESILSGAGQIGNSITAITGSTFSTGTFNIDVTDVQSAQQRKIENSLLFLDGNGSILDRTSSLLGSSKSSSIVLNGSFVDGNYTGGVSLRDGDIITMTGTNADGTTFQGTYTYSVSDTSVDTTLNDFQFNSISGLVRELNYRTRDYSAGVSVDDGVQTRFEDALFTYTSSGHLMLIDDYGRTDSQTLFSFIFENASSNTINQYTIQDSGVLKQEGYAEQATFRIAGGEAVRAEAGSVVTLTGETSTIEGVSTPQVTLRIGSGLSEGIDKLQTKETIYEGRLNGGESVQFSPGDQDIVFNSSASSLQTSKYVTIDFDAMIDVTSDGHQDDPGITMILSTSNTALNFQIGAFSGQDVQYSIGDLRADNLGFGRDSGRTVQDINITSLSGAQDAIDIVDAALDQVNKTRSILGAATNRLESTMANLSVANENLTASESRIRDADIAEETSKYTLNQVLLQVGVSVLAQANFQSKDFLTLLG